MIKKVKIIKNRKISYIHLDKTSKISVLFCPGFNSDMGGSKANHILNWCKNNNIECAMFDYSGHGSSSGNFIHLGIKEWFEDANMILDKVLTNPAIIIGSSMGGWIALNLALKNPKKVCGLIGIATALDFTEKLSKNILTKKQKKTIIQVGYIKIKSKYDPEGYLISKKLLNSGKKYLLTKAKNISILCPVKLIHGTNDEEVNISNSFDIFNKLQSKDVELIIIKNGDHRLSEPKNLKTISDLLQNLSADLLK